MIAVNQTCENFVVILSSSGKTMQIEANTPDEYLAQVPDERKKAVEKLRKVIHDNLPTGFKEVMSYGMIGYVIPHTLYPPGYQVDPRQPLPFINLASQKNHIAIYHMGLYTDPELLLWFKKEYGKYTQTKLDMGKSCIRFGKPEKIPYKLIGQLVRKISAEEWIERYEILRQK